MQIFLLPFFNYKIMNRILHLNLVIGFSIDNNTIVIVLFKSIVIGMCNGEFHF